MTPAPPATSTDATTATEPVVCPGCDSLLYQQPRSGKSSMLCAGCHATLSWDGRQLQNVNLSRGPQANRAARAIVPLGTNGWAIAASYLALIGMISCGFVGPFAVILGIVALVSLKKNPGQRGTGRAWFSVVIGTGSTLLAGAILVMIFTQGLSAFSNVEEVNQLNSESWSVVRHPGDTRENYETALQRATRASELQPTNGVILNTLGVAQYRATLYVQCIETLTRANGLHSGFYISDWTFIAMSHHRLGDHDAAQEALTATRRIITAVEIEPGSEDAGFVKEMEELFASQPLPDDDSN